MWHHFVSNSYLIIGHIAQHYARVLSKITNLTNVDTSGDKNHFWLSIQKVDKLLDIIGAFRAKMRLLWEGGGIFRGSVWSSCCIFRLQNTIDYQPKSRNDSVITSAFWEKFRKIYMTHKSIVQSKIQSIFRQQNHNWLSDKNSKWFVLLHAHFEKNYVKFIRRKRV